MTRVSVTFHAGIKQVFGESGTKLTLSGDARLRGLLESLCVSKERRDRLFTAGGELRTDVTVLLNGRNVVFLQGLNTALHNGDTVALFPPVYGG